MTQQLREDIIGLLYVLHEIAKTHGGELSPSLVKWVQDTCQLTDAEMEEALTYYRSIWNHGI